MRPSSTRWSEMSCCPQSLPPNRSRNVPRRPGISTNVATIEKSRSEEAEPPVTLGPSGKEYNEGNGYPEYCRTRHGHRQRRADEGDLQPSTTPQSWGRETGLMDGKRQGHRQHRGEFERNRRRRGWPVEAEAGGHIRVRRPGWRTPG